MDTMSIVATLIGLQQQQVGQNVGVSVFKMAMNSAEITGDMLNMMSENAKELQVAAHPYLGVGIDISV